MEACMQRLLPRTPQYPVMGAPVVQPAKVCMHLLIFSVVLCGGRGGGPLILEGLPTSRLVHGPTANLTFAHSTIAVF